MRTILIAEDDRVSRSMLEAILRKWSYDVVATNNGQEAWQVMQAENPPMLAIVDWMMPRMDGLEFCRKVRESAALRSRYIILLTTKRQKDEVVMGLESGASDYIRKPFDREELLARIRVGERIIELQSSLARQVKELQEALSKIKTLQGLIPICSYCRRIRDDRNYWQQLESYLAEHSEATLTHGVCPDCQEKYIESQLKGSK
jgi:sigma-B regulation protein RsbU (phosphoserine phosphatase)